MAVEVEDLIKEYYEQVKEKYGLEYEHFSAICKAPFLFFKKMMELPELPTINIKYLGKFLVYPGKILSLLTAYKGQMDKGEITPEEYEQKVLTLNAKLNEREDNDDTEGPTQDD